MGRTFKRGLEEGAGVINLEIVEESAKLNVSVNFHLASTEPKTLGEWLLRSDEFHDRAFDLLGLLGMQAEGE